MKIIGLAIDNMRKIKAMELTFNEKGITEIKGGNEQCKSTVIDCIEILFRGKKAMSPDMITHGENKAGIEGTLQDGEDEYIVKRIMKKNKNPTLKITKNGGKMEGKLETFLSSLVDKLTFNPDDFESKSDDEKLKYMKEFAGIDFTLLDAKIKDVFDERTVVGREIKKFGDIRLPEKVEKVSMSDLLEERKEMIEFNQGVDDEIHGIESHKSTIADLV